MILNNFLFYMYIYTILYFFMFVVCSFSFFFFVRFAVRFGPVRGAITLEYWSEIPTDPKSGLNLGSGPNPLRGNRGDFIQGFLISIWRLLLNLVGGFCSGLYIWGV